jgi:acyl carrier protein
MPFPSIDEVVQELRTITEDDGISADSKFVDLDIDSLDVLEWVFEIERRADMEIDDSIYDNAALETATIRDFYERIKQSVPT